MRTDRAWTGPACRTASAAPSGDGDRSPHGDIREPGKSTADPQMRLLTLWSMQRARKTGEPAPRTVRHQHRGGRTANSAGRIATPLRNYDRTLAGAGLVLRPGHRRMMAVGRDHAGQGRIRALCEVARGRGRSREAGCPNQRTPRWATPQVLPNRDDDHACREPEPGAAGPGRRHASRGTAHRHSRLYLVRHRRHRPVTCVARPLQRPAGRGRRSQGSLRT